METKKYNEVNSLQVTDDLRAIFRALFATLEALEPLHGEIAMRIKQAIATCFRQAADDLDRSSRTAPEVEDVLTYYLARL